MKIKINNIFKKVKINKVEARIIRRKNIEQIDEEKNNNKERVSLIREKRRKVSNETNEFKKIFKSLKTKKSYYVVFMLMISLAGISIYVNFKTYNKLNDETYLVFNNEIDESSVSVASNYQDENTNNTDTRKAEISKNEVIKNENSKQIESKPKIPELSFTSPLNGKIIKNYSEDKVIYSKTLESWKTHDGIDITGNIGDKVKSIEKGIIEKVYLDSFLGNTVVIDHGQGYKSIYSNLDANINVKVKQTVKKSSVIGIIGNTAIGEIKDESHIHFMLMFNNKVIDPASKIKF